jgi:hypothetical protein
VRDCHAEILARKGLIKYLYTELNRLLIVHKNEESENKNEKNANKKMISKEKNSSYDTTDNNDYVLKYKDLNKDNIYDNSDNDKCDMKNIEESNVAKETESLTYFKINEKTGLLQLQDNCTIHLYTSSQPCGNATIKKWARGKKPER